MEDRLNDAGDLDAPLHPREQVVPQFELPAPVQ